MSSRLRGFVVGAVLVVGASPAGAVLSPPQQLCQQEVARLSRSFYRSVARALRSCDDKINRGILPSGTDCLTDAAVMNKIANAEAALTTKLTPSCPDATVASLVFSGACFGVTTTADLIDCLGTSHQAQAEAGTALDVNAPGALAPAQLACQRVLTKNAQSFASGRLKLIQDCQNGVSSGALPANTDCVAYTQTAVQNKRASALARIQARCADPTVTGLPAGACGSAVMGSVGANVGACYLCSYAAGTDKLVDVEYGTSGPVSVSPVTLVSQCVQGPLSRCRVGDYLLENDRIRVVVQATQRNLFGIGQFGGQIIDADLVRTLPEVERDNFEEWATAINIENTAHYTGLSVVNDGSDGEAAILRATGVDDLLDFINPSAVVAGFGFPFPDIVDDRDLPITIQTDYILEPGKNSVRVETTLVNTGATSYAVYLGEFINGSGEINLWQPAYGFGQPLATTSCPTTAPNLCNTVVYAGFNGGAGVSYGYVHNEPGSTTFTTSGVTVPLLRTEAVAALVGAAPAPTAYTFQPSGSAGDRFTITRHFIVGDGTVSSVLDTRNEVQCRLTGTLSGTVTQGGSPVTGAQVAVLGSAAVGPGGLAKNVVTHTLTDATGAYSVTLPPGSYNVMANVQGGPFEGGGASAVQHAVAITAFTTATQNMALPATGRLQVTVVDETPAAIPAKVSVVGFDPSADPRNTQSIFGIINNNTGVFNDLSRDGLPFGLAQVHFLDLAGDTGVVDLEPGSYRVVASRGPEWSAYVEDIVVTAGVTETVNAQITRVIDSSGFVASDFHVHSIDSPDAQTSRVQRVVSMLAEGAEFYTTSDHDIRTDHAPTVAALGASSLLSTVPGGEITSFDYGHFNAWPMTIDPTKVNGGSVDFCGAAPDGFDFPAYFAYCLIPADIIAAAHGDPGVDTVQINHIHSHFAIDGSSGLAIDTGLTPPASGVPGGARRLDPLVTNYFTDTFDALEVWIGDDRGQVFTNFLGRNAGDWFNMLNQGIIRTGIADSDTHSRIGGVAAMPRSMVASPTDSPGALAAIADTLSANVNARRSIGTNAPMVRVTASATSTGDLGGLELGLPTLIATTDGKVDITVDIQSPIWAPFDRVEYYINTTTTKTTASGNVKLPGNLTLTAIPYTKYSLTPDHVQTVTPSPFTVNGSIPGADRLEASTTLNLTGLTEDFWVVVMVKGTDGVSEPAFPIIPSSLKTSTNTTFANLIDGNLGEDGMLALAFTNPILVDVDGGGWTPPGVQIAP